MAPGVNISQFPVIHETDKARLVSIPKGYTQFAGYREVWIPKSQITSTPNPNPCFSDLEIIPAWLARKLDF